jgi:hypothetical protein
MKRFNLKSFVLGVLVTALIFSMAMPAFASVNLDVLTNFVNVVLRGNKELSVGENFIHTNGEEIPSSIVYRGATYLPLRRLAELIGMEVGWDGSTNTVTLNDAGAPAPQPPPSPQPSPNPSETLSQRNAVAKAKQYLDLMAFSRTGLISQLEFEGFSNSDAIYGADNSGADWYEQAAKKAQQYLDIMSFSRQRLIDQLIFEGFTQSQAVHGVDAVGL